MNSILQALAVTVPWTGAFSVALMGSMIVFYIRNSVETVDENEWARQSKLRSAYNDQIVQDDKGATDLAVMALKSAIILNGTAAAAALAFIGRLVGVDGSAAATSDLTSVFAILVTGALFATVATGFGYLRMYFGTVNWFLLINQNRNSNTIIMISNFCQGIAFFLVIESYALFGYAMLQAVKAFQFLPVT